MRRWNFKQDKDFDAYEKMGKMRGKDRKNKVKQDDIAEQFFLNESKWKLEEGFFCARVVEVHKRAVFLSPEPVIGDIQTRDVWMGRVAGKFYTADRRERNFICVGERVLCRPAEKKEMELNSDLPQCMILHAAPRKSKIARVDPAHEEREHVLAANVDLLLIVASFLSPRIKWGLIDRYLVLAELQNIRPLIVFNKMDLLEEDQSEHPDFYAECVERRDYYAKLGYDIFTFQATASGISRTKEFKRLGEHLKDKIAILSGHSGVGKSSIINLFKPEIEQDVEPNSDIFYKGRHTTTYASFIKLRAGGYAIDTPGIRSFVLAEYSAFELATGYREMSPFALQCRYRGCRHIDEPDCAVVEAVTRGEIASWRYQNYRGILLGTTGREGRKSQTDIE